MNNHSFCEREIPLRQRQLKLQNSCGSGWERTEWDGPSIIEKQNLIGAWRAQHSFLAHPQPQAMIRISRAYNFAGFWEPPVQRCICRLVQCIQEQVQVLCMHAPGQNVQRYICWLVVVCKMRLSAARSGSFENRQLYQWVAGISFSSIVSWIEIKNFQSKAYTYLHTRTILFSNRFQPNAIFCWLDIHSGCRD